MSNIVPLWRLEIHGNELHQINYNNMGDGLPNKQEFAQLRTEPYRLAVEGGLSISSDGSRHIALTPAEVFFGHRHVSVLGFDSATDLVHDYRHVAGVWEDVETASGYAWDPNNRDDGTSLVTIGSGKWGALYVWRSVGDDKEIFVARGSGEYTSYDKARADKAPAIPPLIAWSSILVGRILFLKGGAEYFIESAVDPAFSVGGASTPSIALNDLTDVDTTGAVTGDMIRLESDGVWRRVTFTVSTSAPTGTPSASDGWWAVVDA
jgi:hypothetical protein